MEHNHNEEKKKSRKTKVNTTPIRVYKPTAKSLKGTVQKLNKKPHGRKVRVDDVLLKALSLLEDKHFEEIQNSTLSNADRLEVSYREYCKTNEQISKDEYLGQLLAGKNQPTSEGLEVPSQDHL